MKRRLWRPSFRACVRARIAAGKGAPATHAVAARGESNAVLMAPEEAVRYLQEKFARAKAAAVRPKVLNPMTWKPTQRERSEGCSG